MNDYLFRWRGSPWLRVMLFFALVFFDHACKLNEPSRLQPPPPAAQTLLSAAMANLFLISLKTEIRKLRNTQEEIQANSGASIMHVNHRLELLDRMLSLLERQQTMQTDSDTSPPVREIAIKKIAMAPVDDGMQSV